jgi:glycosyltransferase involved in cell wall biosynthesis
MRVMFVDGSSYNYSPSALQEQPLGGSQSALLTVAAELSRLGWEVLVASPHFTEGQAADGYHCVHLDTTKFDRFPDVEVVISLNILLHPEFLSRHFTPGFRYLHWHQNDARSPYGTVLADSNNWRHVNHFVFVSHYQAGDFIARFGMSARAISVIGNPVPDLFLSLLPDGEEILSRKDPGLLVYSSAPNRGLAPLIRTIWPELHKQRPDLRLEIYSGFYMDHGVHYQGSARTEADAALAEAKRSPGVTVNRGVAKQELAQRLASALMFCYPCIFRETFCSAVREAMAAGCLVCATASGALPETTAGFAGLTAVSTTATQFVYTDAGSFVKMTLAALDAVQREPKIVERRLRQQIEYVRTNSAPVVIAGQWRRLLEAQVAQV